MSDMSDGRRFYVYDEDNEREWLDAETVEDAIEEVGDFDHVRFGQTVDIYERVPGEEVPVATCVDVQGFEVEEEEVATCTAYEHLATAIFNDDRSGFDEDGRDDEALDDLYDYLKGFRITGVKGEPYFGTPEPGGLPGRVVDYEIVAVEDDDE